MFQPRFVFVVLILAGCNPAYSPPARVAVGGMPEPKAQGAGSLQINAMMVTGEVRGEYGLTDRLTLDVGVTAAPYEDGFLMTGGSLRYHPFDVDVFRMGLSVGAAVGVGGSGKDDSRSAFSRFAMSGYAGLDLGARVTDWFGVYVGTRYQISQAEDAPLTHWGLYLAGVQFDVGPVFIAPEGGFAQHLNSGGGSGWVGGSLGIRFGGPDGL